MARDSLREARRFSWLTVGTPAYSSNGSGVKTAGGHRGSDTKHENMPWHAKRKNRSGYKPEA
jgi:hypothetical protein